MKFKRPCHNKFPLNSKSSNGREARSNTKKYIYIKTILHYREQTRDNALFIRKKFPARYNSRKWEGGIVNYRNKGRGNKQAFTFERASNACPLFRFCVALFRRQSPRRKQASRFVRTIIFPSFVKESIVSLYEDARDTVDIEGYPPPKRKK